MYSPFKIPSKILVTLALVALVFSGTACGGGGGGGGGGGPTPPTPPPPSSGIAFTPGGGSGTNSLSLQENGQSTTEITLNLRADSVSGLYGVSFDLFYPDDLLRFEDATEGTFLNGGGVATSFLFDKISDGQLVVGLTRLGAVGGVGGSGSLLSLRFTAIGSGMGSFNFSNEDAFDTLGNPQGAVTWVAGTVMVTL